MYGLCFLKLFWWAERLVYDWWPKSPDEQGSLRGPIVLFISCNLKNFADRPNAHSSKPFSSPMFGKRHKQYNTNRYFMEPISWKKESFWKEPHQKILFTGMRSSWRLNSGMHFFRIRQNFQKNNFFAKKIAIFGKNSKAEISIWDLGCNQSEKNFNFWCNQTTWTSLQIRAPVVI